VRRTAKEECLAAFDSIVRVIPFVKWSPLRCMSMNEEGDDGKEALGNGDTQIADVNFGHSIITGDRYDNTLRPGGQ